jgi:nucleoside-diphosphate-sugar epimerase
MRYVVVGCGNIGLELAARWTRAGHRVVGATTTPGRVDEVGSVPFDGDALIYRIDYATRPEALDFVVTHDLTGVYNAVPDAVVPLPNREFFAAIPAGCGFPELTYRGEIATPAVPITSARLRAAGFAFTAS